MTDPHLHEARTVTQQVAKTFALATRLLPSDLRNDVYLLYLVCRSLDDLVDTRQPEARRRLEEVQRWAAGLGPAVGQEEVILTGLRQRHPSLPLGAIVDFCEGQLADLGPVRMQTEAELDLHAYRVAGTVGLLMAALLGVRDCSAHASAIALGIAMQRTNILRDIDEDLAASRVYVPVHTMEETGVENLSRDDRTRLLQAEIAIADRWYARGLAGTRLLARGGWQVRAAGLMYQEILRELERRGLGRTRPDRASVGSVRKLVLIGKALAGSLRNRSARLTPGQNHIGLEEAAQYLQMSLHSTLAPTVATLGVDEQGHVRQRVNNVL